MNDLRNVKSENIINVINKTIKSKNLIDLLPINYSEMKARLLKIVENIETLIASYPNIFTEYDQSNVIFSSYYDNSIDKESYLDIFKESDIENEYDNFLVYVLYIKLIDLNIIFGDSYIDEDWLEILTEDNIISELEYFLNTLLNNKELARIEEEERKKYLLPFLSDDNKFKIFFPGVVRDDILKLENKFLGGLINKLEQLSDNYIVPGTENLAHTNSLYNVSFKRVHFSADYRLVFSRYKNITIILTIFLKQGSNYEYEKSDTSAKNYDKILEELQLFLNGNKDLEHYRIVDYLQNYYKKKCESNNKVKK